MLCSNQLSYAASSGAPSDAGRDFRSASGGCQGPALSNLSNVSVLSKAGFQSIATPGWFARSGMPRRCSKIRTAAGCEVGSRRHPSPGARCRGRQDLASGRSFRRGRAPRSTVGPASAARLPATPACANAVGGSVCEKALPQAILRNELACLPVDGVHGADGQLSLDGNDEYLLSAAHDPCQLRVAAPCGHHFEAELVEHAQDVSPA